MTWSVFGRRFDSVGAKRLGRNQKARPRRLQPGVDGLESRNLMTGGISLSAGTLTLAAPLYSGNVASVAYNNDHSQIVATLDGHTEQFAAADVDMIVYMGGFGGHDTYTQSTDKIGIVFGYTGSTFTGGSGEDDYFIWGNGTTIHDASPDNFVFSHRFRNNMLDGNFTVAN